VGKLLDGEQKTKEILQSSFDLLAELMKFNIEAFKIAEDVLRTTELVSVDTVVGNVCWTQSW